jgi:hypothetical protein
VARKATQLCQAWGPRGQEEGQEEEEEDRSSGSDDDDDERAVKKKRLSRTSRTKKKKRKKKRRRTQDETGVGRVLSSGVEESSSSEDDDDDARREDGGDCGDKDDDRPDISESVCFVCRLGGNLMMCDYKGCPKVYVQTGEKAKKIAQKLLRKLHERLHKSCTKVVLAQTNSAYSPPLLCLRSLSQVPPIVFADSSAAQRTRRFPLPLAHLRSVWHQRRECFKGKSRRRS